MYFFTSDQHFFHKNIIKYCNRPFNDVQEMNNEIIKRHNEIVTENDITIHVGDLTLITNWKLIFNIISQLKGKHIFLKGSHDRWLNNKDHHEIWEGKIEDKYVVACHYSMRVWPRSHYGSWLVYGHSHGNLPPLENQWDVGVDNNDFYPVSFNKLKEIMERNNNE